MKRIDRTVLRGDRVRYATRFLTSTGQFNDRDMGPPPPCHWGHHARGTVIARENGSPLCTVQWDDGREAEVLERYLTKTKERYPRNYPNPNDLSRRGWPMIGYANACSWGTEDQIAELHPSNWMTEEEVEDVRFGVMLRAFHAVWSIQPKTEGRA